MSQIKAVIFDMDGVLIDAKEWHYEALNRALQLFGHRINRSEHLTTYDGLPTSKKLQLLTLDHHFPKSLHGFVNEMKQRYTVELVNSHCKPRFIHEYALSRLKHEGYIVGLASNSIRKTVDLMMEKSNLQTYLNFSLSNQDVKKPKPDPEIYHAAIHRTGYSPHECVVVEDNPHGIEAATRSGAHVMKVDTVDDVNYQRIKAFISNVDQTVISTPLIRKVA